MGRSAGVTRDYESRSAAASESSLGVNNNGFLCTTNCVTAGGDELPATAERSVLRLAVTVLCPLLHGRNYQNQMLP